MNTAKVVGLAMAGLLIITVGITPCFALNAASYWRSSQLWPSSTRLRCDPGRAPNPAGVRAVIAYARTDAHLWLPLTMMAIVGLLAFNFLVVLPVFARDTFGGSGGSYGSTLLGIGSIGGSLSIGLMRQPRLRHLS